jgi:hypothetical protein
MLAVALFASVVCVLAGSAHAECEPGYVVHPLAPDYCMEIGGEACKPTGAYCRPGWHCCRTAEQCRVRYHSRDGCFAGSEAAAKLYAEDQQKERQARRTAEQQLRPPSTSATHCEQLLAPGAWAFESKCVQGGGAQASAANRAARDNWIRQSISELAQDLNSGAPLDQLPPNGDAVASAVPQGASPASQQAAPQSSPQSATPQDQQAALRQDQPNAAPSDDQCPPAIPASYWQNGPNADYCAKANCVERGSALYGYLCAPDPSSPTAADTQDDGTAALEQRLRSKLSKIQPRTYKPPMSPQALRALAYNSATCRKKPLAEKPRCFEDAEVGILLGADVLVDAVCASIADSIARHNKAVDDGPGPDWLKAQRQWVCAADPDVRTACASITDRQAQLDCVDAVYVRGPGAYGDGLRTTLQKSINDGLQK